jgi:uncharacterized protein
MSIPPTWPTQPPAFHVMVKPRGSICNLDCHYCFYLKKEQLYPDAHFRMSDELLEQYTLQYINAQQTPQVTFAWQGGEPTLMGLDFFRKAVELQAKHAKPGMQIQNAFQTNGTLLNDAWCEFFHQNNFLVGLSIDGPADLHDIYRQDKGGHPTFELVFRAAALLKKHHVEFNTLTCVNAANAGHGLEVYRFLRDEVGSRFMQFIPIVERDNQTGNQEGRRISERSVNGPQYASFLIDIFDEWVRQDVARVYVQLFDVALAAWVGQRPGLCIFEETCGLGLAMEFNGDVYSCDHFVEPNFLLGNIAQQPLGALVLSPQQFQFGQHKKDRLPGYCRDCEVRFICNGGCPKDRLLKTPAQEPGLNYLCAGYRAFFNYIDQPMKLMAALLNMQRPPAEIMKLIASEPTLSAAAAGSACPCGSGKPVEQCHRAPGGFTPPNHGAPPPRKIQNKRNRH